MRSFHAFFAGFRPDVQSLGGWLSFIAFTCFIVGMSNVSRNAVLLSRSVDPTAKNKSAEIALRDFHDWHKLFFGFAVACETLLTLLWVGRAYSSWANTSVGVERFSAVRMMTASTLVVVVHVAMARRYRRESAEVLGLAASGGPDSSNLAQRN